ncbi:hypothetical protein AK830_g4868 [Neonectria ditissima]|uniref:Zn(2)-C6 fungal-type domain-containing protein n=1 Tax=Neonectria ditissima TaxID=78410 RepID=A0A0P7BFE2_9HYPO|nr:hypothetical protein AK830_g4868 [Neonectria ditissima]
MSESRTRRKRLVLSCFECKRRKLKCGRETPVCSRCINVGTPELCKYDPRFSDMDLAGLAAFAPTTSESSLPSPTLDNFDATLIGDSSGQLSPWLPFQIHLDSDSSYSTEVSSGDTLVDSLKSQMQQELPVSADQSKSLKGRFHGPSHSTSIMASFQDLRQFMKQTVEQHHILGAPQWATYTPSPEQPLPSHSRNGVEQVMNRLLPPQERCRRLAKTYFDHFTGIYALFHVPSFWDEYQNYWDGTHNDPARFNAILLAVMSCARCLFLDDPLSFDGASSTARNEAAKWLHAVETWQGYRTAQSTTVHAFQLRCLLLFSKTLNDIDPQDHYTASQTLLADAISNGIHRDWNLLGVDESVYERELRHKVWSAVAELDIAASIECGVPSMVSSLFADIGQPKGYNDGDYDSSTEFEPPDPPIGQLRDGSFAKTAHSIRPLRYKINDLVNNPQKHNSLDQAQLVALRMQIFETLDGMPNWSDPAPDVAGRNQGLVYRAVLELYLHELLLLLHIPFALAKDSAAASPALDTDFQRFICVRSASTIIKIHELVADKGFSPIALGKAHLLRAGLCLCLLESGAMNYGISSLPISLDAQTKLVKSALAMVEHHVLILGNDLQSLWLFSAASCYVESRRNPSASSASKKRVTDNIIALFSKMCLAQEHKNIGFGLSDSHFARYIMQIRQVCEAVG